jgi:predicted AlkP superfamily pyrophosphatase or phosphodiesterase
MRHLAFLLSLVLAAPAVPGSAQAAKPKLLVVVVVDQMRADYLVRYAGLFDQGLKRLTRDGAWFQNAAYPYLETLTCVGHTTIGTGTLPWNHGVIQNAWYDRASGRSVTCTQDPEVTGVGYGRITGTGESAHRMLRPSLAETMKKTAGARVVTMSLKPRSAIGLAGHAADAVLWLDDRGAWQTSGAYTGEPLAWVTNFIRANPLDRDAGKSWTRALPAERYDGPDEPPGEKGPTGWSAPFPHELGPASDRLYYAHWTTSPYADQYLAQMAEGAIDALGLGQRDATDFLGVSFSTLDLVGHSFGPRSHEVQDVLVGLDRTLGRFLDALDRKVGAGNYVLALSADHGVADVPDQTTDGGRVLATVLTGAIDAVLKGASYGEGPFVAATAGADIYLKPGIYDRLRADGATLEAVRTAMARLSGVARVLTADEVSPAAARQSGDAQIRAAALSYFPGRSGDLFVITKPAWFIGNAVATHGTLHPYDQRVPVLFFGAGVKPGAHPDAATPADIAPTLAAIAGVPLGPVDGHVLTAAVRK